MFNKRSLLLLSVVAFLTISFTTFSAFPANFSPPQWHICPVPTNSTSNAVAGDLSSSNVTVSNETIVDIDTVVWENTNLFSFKRSPNVYVFYATTDEYACSVMVNIHRLKAQFHTRHRIHVLLSSDVSRAFVNAIAGSGATVTIRDPPPLAQGSAAYYKDCLLKLMAFGLHQLDDSIERVAVLDADQLILQDLDHVFDLPQTDLAAPRADWLAPDAIASTFMVISLSDRLWETVRLEMENIEDNFYDMDLINKIFVKKVLLLPSNYVALNSLWHSRTTPDWYRPEEGQKPKRGSLTEEQRRLQGESFWRALSIMNEDNPFAKDMDKELQLEERHQEDRKAPPMGLKIKRAPNEATPEPSVSLNPSSTDPLSESSVSSQESASPTAANEDASPASTSESPSHEASHGPSSTRKHVKPLASPSPDRKHFTPPTDPLQALYERNAKILHFTAGGKPWSYTVDELTRMQPGAHPLYYEQYATWRQEAKIVCPMVRRVRYIQSEDGEGTTAHSYHARIVEDV